MTQHYCCYFDHRYLPRGLAMIRSLRRYQPDSPVWVLCLDDVCHRMLTVLDEPNVRLVTLAEFEHDDPALRSARSNRSLVEYYFTCTPSLVRYVLGKSDPGDSVTYVDGDLYFFSDPQPLHDELGSGAVSLIEHRFPEAIGERIRYGVYNVGWLTFRNDSLCLAVVEWWRDRCNEWCYDLLEDDRFADQKYLDRFGELFKGVVVLRNEGANVAPWNIARYRVSVRGDTVMLNGKSPLVFFHFHGLKALGGYAYLAAHRPYRAPFDGDIRRAIYRPYVAELAAIDRELASKGLVASAILERRPAPPSPMGRAWPGLNRIVDGLPMILRGQVLLVVAGRVF